MTRRRPCRTRSLRTPRRRPHSLRYRRILLPRPKLRKDRSRRRRPFPQVSRQRLRTAASTAPMITSAAQVAPDRPVPPVNLGIVPNPAKAETLADQVIQAHAQGAPMVLVKSQIPGVQLTLAQASQNPGVARLESMMRDQNPNAFAALESSNQTNRNAYLQGIALTPDDVDQMQSTLTASEAANRDAAFANARPVDAMPSLNHFDDAISNARGNGPVVKSPSSSAGNISYPLSTNVKRTRFGNIIAATARPGQSLERAQSNRLFAFDGGRRH